MTVNVLGAKYRIKVDNSLIENGTDGDCNDYKKLIRIRDPEEMLDSSATAQAKEERCRQVKRHELLHAFLHESGLEEYSADEVLVGWIALQFPKLLKAFRETEAIEVEVIKTEYPAQINEALMLASKKLAERTIREIRRGKTV